MPSRQVFFLNNLGTANVSSNVRTDVTALTFTNVLSGKYFVGGSWAVRASEANNNVYSQIVYMEAAATTTICDFAFAPITAADMEGQFGFRRITTPASVGTQHINFRLHVSANTKMSEVKNIRLWAIKSTAADGYGEKETQETSPSSRWNSHSSAAFTPASQGDYVVMAVGGLSIQPGGQRHRGARLLHQGTAAVSGYMGMYGAGGAVNPGSCFPFVEIINMAAGSNKLEYQWASSCTTITSVNCNYSRIAALRADAFSAVYRAVSDTTTSISAATFVTALQLATAMTADLKYGILSLSRGRSTSITNAQDMNFMVDGVTASETIILNQGTAPGDYEWDWHQNTFMTVISASGGSHEFSFRGHLSATGAELNIAQQRIVLMRFDAPAAAGGGFKPWWIYHQINYGLH